jgi:inosine-uridine nucleoside N-ribohydrolase
MKQLYLSLMLLTLGFMSVTNVHADATNDRPLSVIFDTDMGNDVDDVLALDLLYKYMDMGHIRLLAIMTNQPSDASPRFLDVMNRWYGYAKIPIGTSKGGGFADTYATYAQKTLDLTDKKGKPLFKCRVKNPDRLPDATTLYRRILTKQPDHSVVIISTGFSTNLARLLNSGPDKWSSLAGIDLVAKKVKYLSLMAGCFDDPKRAEYNVVKDVDAAKALFETCKVPIVTSPWELGNAIRYPGKSIADDFGWTSAHPLVEAYKAYAKMPYDRPTWDLTAVVQVLHPDKYMTASPTGVIRVDKQGHTLFTPDPAGRHRYLTVDKHQIQDLKSYFVSVITKQPKHRKK